MRRLWAILFLALLAFSFLGMQSASYPKIVLEEKYGRIGSSASEGKPYLIEASAGLMVDPRHMDYLKIKAANNRNLPSKLIFILNGTAYAMNFNNQQLLTADVEHLQALDGKAVFPGFRSKSIAMICLGEVTYKEEIATLNVIWAASIKVK